MAIDPLTDPNGFLIAGRDVEPKDAAWRNATRAVKRRYFEVLSRYVYKVKRMESLAGLDKYGLPLRPISPATAKARTRYDYSPMGRANPAAPPLIPNYIKSRLNFLLRVRAYPDKVAVWWDYDPFTGRPWGEFLDYHRQSGRDVIGLSPFYRRRAARSARAWWGRHGGSPNSAPASRDLPSAPVEPIEQPKRAERDEFGKIKPFVTDWTQLRSGRQYRLNFEPTQIDGIVTVRTGETPPGAGPLVAARPRLDPPPRVPPAPKKAKPKPVKTRESQLPIEVVKPNEGVGGEALPTRNAVEYKPIPDPSGKGGEEWGEKHWGEWGKTLSKWDRKSVAYYTDEGFKEINGYLRNPPKNPTNADLDARMSAASIDKVFKNAPTVPEDILVYRGFGLDALGLKSGDIKPGLVLRDPAFTSTSIDRRHVEIVEFGGDDRILAEIRVAKGTKAIWVNSAGGTLDEERELLLDRKVDEFVVVETHPDRIIFEARSSNVQR